jgi:hypothetical protein
MSLFTSSSISNYNGLGVIDDEIKEAICAIGYDLAITGALGRFLLFYLDSGISTGNHECEEHM